MRGLGIVCAVLVSFLSQHARAQRAPRTRIDPSDIDGIWLNDTMTPLARPLEFAGKPFFSEAEARDFEAHFTDRTRARGGATDVLINGEEFEPGHVLPNRRTSLIVDSPDGQVPALTRDAQTRAAARDDRFKDHFADGPENLPLSEQCVMHLAGPPMMPGPYNNNVQILHTRATVMIFNETMHEVRVVPLDGRPHLPTNIRQWKGDSRGRWDRGSLVVDTTNFTDRTTFNGSGEGLHVIERFTRLDAGTLRYEFTIDDPASFARRWSAESVMTKSEQAMYEFACHEGNYSLLNTLRGARFAEKNR